MPKIQCLLFSIPKRQSQWRICFHDPPIAYMDVIKCADHIIDLGPEGGDAGGEIIATGTPEQIAEIEVSHTGRFLKKIVHSPLISK